jgi:thiamine-phosphate diphosphorylase
MGNDGDWLRPKDSAVLCLVTPGGRLPAPVARAGTASGREPGRVAALVRAAVEAGIDLVQIREPQLDAASLVRLVDSAVEASRGTHTRIVVNDRLDVALASGADGVHLGSRSVPSGRVREIAPGGFLVGRSVHSVGEARSEADGNAVDYLIAGTVFPSASKPGSTSLIGPAGLAEIVRAATVPVLAIGGIDLETVALVAATGAAGIAAISLFDVPDLDLRPVVSSVRERFDRVRTNA